VSFIRVQNWRNLPLPGVSRERRRGKSCLARIELRFEQATASGELM
jgi:hypothetical protein